MFAVHAHSNGRWALASILFCAPPSTDSLKYLRCQTCVVLGHCAKAGVTFGYVSTHSCVTRNLPHVFAAHHSRRLIPIQNEEWTPEIMDALYIDTQVTVRIHKVGGVPTA